MSKETDIPMISMELSQDIKNFMKLQEQARRDLEKSFLDLMIPKKYLSNETIQTSLYKKEKSKGVKDIS